MNLHTLLQIQPANAKEAKGLESLGKASNVKAGANASEFENLLSMMNSGKLSEEDLNQAFNAIQDGDAKAVDKLVKELSSKISNESQANLLNDLSDSDKKLSLVQNDNVLNDKGSNELKNILSSDARAKTTDASELQSLETKVTGKKTEVLKDIAPKNPELKEAFLKNSQGEVKQALPQVAKKEAVVTQKNELMDFNQFMSKQSPVVQKRMAMHSYGNQQEKKLFDQKFDAKVDTSILSRPEEKEVKISSQEAKGDLANQLMQNSEHRHPQTIKATSQNMTFDMNKLTSSDSQKVIDQVQNYIVQTRAGNEQKVEMSFQHNDLGKVDLMVEKMGKDALNIRIQTHGSEGASFFQKHQGELVQNLNNSGIQVASFKLESAPSNSSSNQQFAGNHSDQSSQGQQQFHGQDQRRQDSERRAELWKILSEREAA